MMFLIWLKIFHCLPSDAVEQFDDLPQYKVDINSLDLTHSCGNINWSAFEGVCRAYLPDFQKYIAGF